MQLVPILFFVFYAITAAASVQDIRFERIGVEDGMSSNAVNAIIQGRQGFLWFATFDGLNRYDGYQFKIYKHDPKDLQSLSDNVINDIHEDAQGNLWIATHNGGLNLFNRKTGRFTRFNHDPNNANSLSSNRVHEIEAAPNNAIWIGTDNGLDLLNITELKFQSFDNYSQTNLSNNQIMALHVDRENNLWIGTQNGLNLLHQRSGKLTQYHHQVSNPQSISSNQITSVLTDNHNNLWVGTRNGLNQFNPTKAVFTRFLRQPTEPKSLVHNMILSLHLDNSDRLWIGTQNGLSLMIEQDHFINFKHQKNNPYSLGNNKIGAIYSSPKDNIMWLGVFDSGINKFDPRKLQFNLVNNQLPQFDSLSNNSIRAIHQQPNQTLWIGTSDGLNRYQPQCRCFKTYRHHPSIEHSISGNYINAIYTDSRNQLWISNEQGLDRYNPQNDTFERISHDRITVIYEDSQKNLWFGSWQGLIQFSPDSGRLLQHRHDPNDSTSISHNHIQALHEDKQGILWVGTFGGGLNRLDPQTGQFRVFKHQQHQPNSLSHNTVTSIYQDNLGQFWVATYGGGLNKFDRFSGTFSHYRKPQGLPNDTVYAILEDNQSHLWLSTNAGLSRFSLKTQTFNHYDINDGLQGNEFNRGAYFRSPKGELFFGGINGYNHFFPQQLHSSLEPPPVVISDFLLFNRPVPVHPLNQSDSNQSDSHFFALPQTIDSLKQLKLSHHENLVTFIFSALSYTNPSKNQFAYRLKGFDKNWVLTDSDNRRATYTNLPAGHYTLEVKATNSDGIWNENGATLKIKVDPAPWFSWWAWSLYTLAILLLLLEFVRRHRNQIKQAQSINQQLKQIDRLKDEFLANTSHELRTPLNGIIGLTESLLDSTTEEISAQAKHDLTLVVASGRRLANLVNDILDFSKLRNHDLELNTKAIDLYSMVEVVLALSRPLLKQKDLKLINQISPNFAPVEADEDRLQQILHNLIGNAIKFTDQGQITIEAQIKDQRIEVSISDTGIGIDPEQQENIFGSFTQTQSDIQRNYNGTGLGLSICKQLVALHGGDIKVQSTPQQGSTFSFSLSRSTQPIISPIHVDQTITKLHQLEDQTTEYQLPTEQASQESKCFKLLLVDDDPINLKVLINHLQSQPYQLIQAQGGQQALDILASESPPFDLILLDIMMPNVSGYEVCKQIRQRFAVNDLPVIFLTAKNQVSDLIQSFSAGANDYIGKPVSKHELLTRVATHLKLLEINRGLEETISQRTRSLEQKNRQIIQNQQQLMQAEKLASLGTLTSGVAHEINNPINYVVISGQNMAKDLSNLQRFISELSGHDTEIAILESFKEHFKKLYGHLSTIKDGTVRIQTVIKDLHSFTQVTSSEHNTIVITDCLQSTINLVRAQYKNIARFATNFVVEPLILCYPAQLNQLFMHLVVNACDAIAEKQRHQMTDILGQVTISCRIHHNMVEIKVIDDGCGMNSETQKRLFDPFYTTKAQGQGTGLGLSIAYGIAQQHNGTLKVTSQPGVGSEFTLLLPNNIS